MKRDHQFLGKDKQITTTMYNYSGTGTGAGGGSGSSSTVNGKGKMWEEGGDAGVDELLYALGYKVKSSDMADVAQKIEQLEEFIIGNNNVEDIGFSNLGSDNTVHYNPSDLSSWLESMISEINPPPIDASSSNNNNNFDSLDNNSCTTFNSDFSNPPVVFDDSSFDSSLPAAAVMPGTIVYPQVAAPFPAGFMVQQQQPPSKRMRPNSQFGFGVESIRPVVLVDAQENGIRLVHALMACAEAIQQENLKLAEVLVKQIGILSISQAGSMRKVATYFAEALARRIYRLFPTRPNDSAFNNLLQMHFYETCPYLKFAHFTANQAIFEAFVGKSCVHVVDFSLKQGMQWPALLQALALRPGGPPSFRLTGVGPRSNDNPDHLQEVGWKLSQLAEAIHVEFEFRGVVVDSLADLNESMFDIRENETVAVNSIVDLHQLLAKPGGIEHVLSVVKELKPEIFTVVEQEANHNGLVFLNRFTESLHYYSAMFDSLESSNCSGIDNGSILGPDITDQDKVMSEVYLGRQICNLVACEGQDRVERHETLAQWRTRFSSAGYAPVYIGSNAYKQASMLLALFAGGDGYKVEENDGCLMLGWHTRPLIATSAWKLV